MSRFHRSHRSPKACPRVKRGERVRSSLALRASSIFARERHKSQARKTLGLFCPFHHSFPYYYINGLAVKRRARPLFENLLGPWCGKPGANLDVAVLRGSGGGVGYFLRAPSLLHRKMMTERSGHPVLRVGGKMTNLVLRHLSVIHLRVLPLSSPEIGSKYVKTDLPSPFPSPSGRGDCQGKNGKR